MCVCMCVCVCVCVCSCVVCVQRCSRVNVHGSLRVTSIQKIKVQSLARAHIVSLYHITTHTHKVY